MAVLLHSTVLRSSFFFAKALYFGDPLEFLGVPKSIDPLSLEKCWSTFDSSVLSLVLSKAETQYSIVS